MSLLLAMGVTVVQAQDSQPATARDCYEQGVALLQSGTLWRDFKKGVALLGEAAEKGFAPAQTELGKAYQRGLGVRQDMRAAIELWSAAAQAGEAEGKALLAVCYLLGKGLPRDRARGFKLLEEAAEQGQPYATYKLAECYFKGVGAAVNAKRGLALLEQAARLGHREATGELGGLYEYGRGVPVDIERAARLYRKAAEAGYVSAQNNLGQLLLTKGLEGKPDPKAAVIWLRRAVDQDHARACISLGGCYERGLGVERDRVVADALYLKAALLGNASGQFNVGNAYARRKQSAKALSWYEKAARQGHARAQLFLALMYSQGQGTVPSRPKAIALARKAVASGHPRARKLLEALLEEEEKGGE